MGLFVVLIILGVYFFRSDWLKTAQSNGPVLSWASMIQPLTWANHPVVFLIVLLAPVFVLTMFVVPLIEHRVFGIPYLLLSLAVLAFCLGRGNLIDQFDTYTKQWGEGRGKEYLDLVYDDPVVVENDIDVHLAARSGFMYKGIESISCVLFWYVIGGLFVPVTYRMLQILSGKDTPELPARVQSLLKQLIEFIEVIPVTLICFAFNLVSDRKLSGVKEWVHGFRSTTWDIRSMLHNHASFSGLLKPIQEFQLYDLTSSGHRMEFYQEVLSELAALRKAFEYLLILFLIVTGVFLIFT
ncbi:MAG: regulatory signaling modulator protein AmpE [Pseudomonadota bacterium]